MERRARNGKDNLEWKEGLEIERKLRIERRARNGKDG